MIPENEPNSSELNRAELSRVELETLFGRLMRIRLVMAGLALGTLALTFALDVSNRQAGIFAVLSLALATIIVFDTVRLHRKGSGYPLHQAPIDVALIVVVQTVVIWMTGGAESPLLFVYVMPSIASGIVLGVRSRLVVGVLTIALWMLGALGFYGLVPRVLPYALGLTSSVAQRWPYILTYLVILNVVIVVANVLGQLIHKAVNKMLDTVIIARHHALTAQRAKNQELSLLSNAIAHELKNPMASVQGLVQLLARGGQNSARRMEVLGEEVLRMRTILDEFLNFSRPFDKLTVGEVDVRAMLSALLALHEGMALERRISLTSEAPDLRIIGDERKLKQALTNLLQNALEATQTGGEVCLFAEAEPTHILLGVRDSGPGIAPALLSSIERPGATTKAGGSGIGLVVVRTIAEQHEGRLVLINLETGLKAGLHIPRSPHE